MLKFLFASTIFAAGLAVAIASSPAKAQDAGSARSGRIAVNGLDYYYEIHGEGEPLLLLHGGLGSTGMFGPVLPALAEGRQVIAVDLHGHGRTALGQRDINLEDQGDDMAALLKALGHDSVDVLGYSFGGGVGFRLAVQHPHMVRRLAMVSAGFASDGFYAAMREQQVQVSAAMAPMMRETPMYQSYAAVAPHPEDFPKLLDQMGAFMRRDYNYAADAKALEMPVMLVFGDSDMYRPEHIVEFYQLLGGGLRDAGWMRENLPQNRLAIIPNRTHYDIFFAPELVRTVLPFLNGETEVESWEEQLKKVQ